MFFKLVFNLIAIVAIGICGYYTTLYSKLNEDIVELKETMQSTCGRKQQQGAGNRQRKQVARERKQDSNDNEE